MNIFKDFEYTIIELYANYRRPKRREVVIHRYLGKEKEVIVPDSIENITVTKMEAIFTENEEIETVFLPKYVNGVEPETFRGCKSLKYVKIPHTMNYIGKKAFQDCVSLELILFYKLGMVLDYTVIEHNAFNNCLKLCDEEGFLIVKNSLIRYYGVNPHITIPKSVKKIMDFAFSYNSVIESVVISDSVTLIGTAAFLNCKKLVKAVLPEGILNILSETFKGCSYLQEINIPCSLQSIHGDAFEDCDSLENIVLPQLTMNIQLKGYPYSVKMREKFLIDGKEIDKRISKGFSAKDIESYRCDLITKWADISQETRDFFIMHWNKKITKYYEISRTSCEIGKNKLRNLVFLTGTTKDMNTYFNAGCGLELPELELFLEHCINEGKTAETALLLEYKDKNIDKSYLESESLKNELLDFGVFAVNEEELSESWVYYVKNNVITITGYCGENTTEILPFRLECGKCVERIEKTEVGFPLLEQLFLPSGLERIENETFSHSSLKELFIPNTVRVIGDRAFAESELVTVTFEVGHSDIELNRCVFSGCSKLEKVIFANNISEISYAMFSSCVSLTDIALPNRLIKIGRSVFSGCSSLKKVEFPYTLKSIHAFAFEECTSLEELEIPASIEKLNSKAFLNCTGLKKVILSHVDISEHIQKRAFLGCDSLVFIGTEGGINLLEKFQQ